MEKAVGAIDRATRSDPSPLDLARAAGVLERTGLATERAVRYATRLADDLRAELAAHDVTDPAVLQRAPATNHIAMRVLDVLGCAAIARREWSEAERSLGPAWSLRPIEMHALSLVRLYEASGRKEQAREVLLECIVDGAWDRQAERAMVKVSRPAGLLNGSATVLLSIGEEGKVDGVQDLAGDEAVRQSVKALVGVTVPYALPWNVFPRFVLFGNITCREGAPTCGLALATERRFLRTP